MPTIQDDCAGIWGRGGALWVNRCSRLVLPRLDGPQREVMQGVLDSLDCASEEPNLSQVYAGQWRKMWELHGEVEPASARRQLEHLMTGAHLQVAMLSTATNRMPGVDVGPSELPAFLRQTAKWTPAFPLGRLRKRVQAVGRLRDAPWNEVAECIDRMPWHRDARALTELSDRLGPVATALDVGVAYETCDIGGADAIRLPLKDGVVTLVLKPAEWESLGDAFPDL